ncbi:secreted RxLR effector protein 161-like [Drosophila grimshawi]|uniref:secreted RxLR effector protein 161-like n=1 Tax=Drosophila grimshawi TaxID=7222 RepID=UPI001C9351F6|nr:secreted RxLR effector protein 161-like [Drosophila grimshawi]
MSQFNSNYNVEHWKAAKRILRYLSGTKKLGLLYKQTGENLFGVVDADWGANLSDRRSYSGQAFILSGAAVCWEARKQRTVALSSTESEYLAMSEAVKEALYLKALLNSVGKDCATVRLYNDNQSAQKLVKGFGFHPRTKHIDVRHHFIKQKYLSGDIEVEYMQTEQMPADVLTKGLSGTKHRECISSLGVTYI